MDIELWTIIDDKDGIEKEQIYKWFGGSVDQVIGWYQQKNKLKELILSDQNV